MFDVGNRYYYFRRLGTATNHGEIGLHNDMGAGESPQKNTNEKNKSHIYIFFFLSGTRSAVFLFYDLEIINNIIRCGKRLCKFFFPDTRLFLRSVTFN